MSSTVTTDLGEVTAVFALMPLNDSSAVACSIIRISTTRHSTSHTNNALTID